MFTVCSELRPSFDEESDVFAGQRIQRCVTCSRRRANLCAAFPRRVACANFVINILAGAVPIESRTVIVRRNIEVLDVLRSTGFNRNSHRDFGISADDVFRFDPNRVLFQIFEIILVLRIRRRERENRSSIPSFTLANLVAHQIYVFDRIPCQMRLRQTAVGFQIFDVLGRLVDVVCVVTKCGSCFQIRQISECVVGKQRPFNRSNRRILDCRVVQMIDVVPCRFAIRTPVDFARAFVILVFGVEFGNQVEISNLFVFVEVFVKFQIQDMRHNSRNFKRAVFSGFKFRTFVCGRLFQTVDFGCSDCYLVGRTVNFFNHRNTIRFRVTDVCQLISSKRVNRVLVDVLVERNVEFESFDVSNAVWNELIRQNFVANLEIAIIIDSTSNDCRFDEHFVASVSC